MSRCKILQAECNGVYVLKLMGEVRLSSCSALDSAIDLMDNMSDFASLVVDLSETSLVDSTTLGLLAKLALRAKQKSHFLPSIISTNDDITRILTTMGFESIFLIVKEPVSNVQDLIELSCEQLDESQVRDRVLCAHKVLMNLNDHNREQFKDLVGALEGELESNNSMTA